MMGTSPGKKCIGCQQQTLRSLYTSEGLYCIAIREMILLHSHSTPWARGAAVLLETTRVFH